MTNNDDELIFESIKCPFCGSDDETRELDCGCCAICENCGHRFMIVEGPPSVTP